MKNPYWTADDTLAVKKVKTFQDLLEIALGILKKMPQPIQQICGPISTGGRGSMKENMFRFKNAIDVLNENGWNVFDQLPFQEGMMIVSHHLEDGKYDTDILDIFYKGIFESGYVKKAVFLPEWQSSIGAKWEREIVTKLDLEVIEYPEDLFKKVLEQEN